MPTLRDIKRRMTAVASTAKITSAMKMISAVQLRRAQEAILSARPYIEKLGSVMSNLIQNVGDDYSHPLTRKPKEVMNITIALIASDRGLCGSFNTNLLRILTRFVKEELPAKYPNANINFVAVGKRSAQFLKREESDVISEHIGIFSKLKFADAKDIISNISEGFQNGSIDLVYIAFNHFKNLVSQIPTISQLLPIVPQAANEKQKQSGSYQVDYIFEPDMVSILDDLLPKHIDIQLWKTLLESNAAEQAARMMAMENATKNANDLIKSLELAYNKARQAAITKEMLEIVGGAEALKKV